MTFDEVIKLAEECQEKMDEAYAELFIAEGFDPPPWPIGENHHRTDGWIERQKWERENRK